MYNGAGRMRCSSTIINFQNQLCVIYLPNPNRQSIYLINKCVSCKMWVTAGTLLIYIKPHLHHLATKIRNLIGRSKINILTAIPETPGIYKLHLYIKGLLLKFLTGFNLIIHSLTATWISPTISGRRDKLLLSFESKVIKKYFYTCH